MMSAASMRTPDASWGCLGTWRMFSTMILNRRSLSNWTCVLRIQSQLQPLHRDHPEPSLNRSSSSFRERMCGAANRLKQA
jgi:hypothetical protein